MGMEQLYWVEDQFLPPVPSSFLKQNWGQGELFHCFYWSITFTGICAHGAEEITKQLSTMWFLLEKIARGVRSPSSPPPPWHYSEPILFFPEAVPHSWCVDIFVKQMQKTKSSLSLKGNVTHKMGEPHSYVQGRRNFFVLHYSCPLSYWFSSATIFLVHTSVIRNIVLKKTHKLKSNNNKVKYFIKNVITWVIVNDNRREYENNLEQYRSFKTMDEAIMK